MQTAGIEAIPHGAVAPAVSGSTVTRRAIALLTALTSGALLLVAAMLTPAQEGVGTHKQIFAGQPCGWISAMDCPCPTCGMTTAFAHAADGNLLASFITQPMGALLAVATAMTFLLGTFVALTGSRVAHRLTKLWRPRMTWAIAALVIGSWFYKIVVYKGWL